MAKRYIIYANGKDLTTVPVTQNESGKYYRNSAGTYFKPVLSAFDTATPPAGYKTYTDGSHAKHINNSNRNPIDFSLVAGTKITMNVDVKITGATLKEGTWTRIQIVNTDITLAFAHTYEWKAINSTVKAGTTICLVAPQSVTGFAPHLHLDDWSNKGRRVRDIILQGEYKEMANFKKGDTVIFTGVQNVRQGSGTSYPVTGETKVGQISVIEGGPRVADGYTWYDLKGADWVADVGKFRLATEEEVSPQDPVVPPEQTECQKEVKRLEEENKSLQGGVRALEEDLKGEREYSKGLELEIKDLDIKYDGLKEETSRLKDEKLVLQLQLSKCKNELEGGGIWGKIIDWIKNLFVK